MIKGKVAESRAKRGGQMQINGPIDALAALIATGGGAGLIPFGPGTWGSVVGLLLAYGLIVWLIATPLLLQSALVLVGAFLALVGIWAGTRAETIFQRKDAGQIVIDEVCGQLIAFVLVAPYLASLAGTTLGWRWLMVAGFLLFRGFDIFKPYPLRGLQEVTGGLGVMIDDIIAGVYAAIVLSLLLLVTASY